MMGKNCLYCYGPIKEELDIHEKCSMKFIGMSTPPKIEYSLNQMAELAKQVVERSVAVPGGQPKLALSLVKETRENSDS